jgi:hypothetical protein
MLTLAADTRELIPIIAIGGGIGIAIISIILSAIRRSLQTKYREQSRREIAAYVAEGSMSADDGAKLIAAKSKGTLEDRS